MNPRVSFIVPCYKLAHLLGDCLTSILRQSYGHFEVLVMDDESPDDTAAVVRAFGDQRVRHVRNPRNLGHLRNYNKGLTLARGDYVWLISADDTLREPDALQQFVSALAQHPQVTLAFSQAMKVEDGRDLGLLPRQLTTDIVFDREEALELLLDWNCVPSAGAVVRRSAYERAGLFPLDLPHAGDWYLWCRFAVQGPVLYLARPLVNYRFHAANMSKFYEARRPLLVRDELEVRWRIARLTAEAGLRKATAFGIRRLIDQYAGEVDPTSRAATMTAEAAADAIRAHAPDRRERAALLAQLYTALGDRAYARGNRSLAGERYKQALRVVHTHPQALAKLLLLRTGSLGAHVRRLAPLPGRGGVAVGTDRHAPASR
jgi:glycosyltransferase involved in cell wall biosynthesis